MTPYDLLANFEVLAEAPNGIQRLRELVLELAVRGKLVKQDPEDEPVGDLLKRIKREMSQPSTGRKRNNPELASEGNGDNQPPFVLPAGWTWCRLADVCLRIHYGYTAPSTRKATDVRLVRITDIQNGDVLWEQVPGCDISEEETPNFLLHPRDILIARTGGTIGKTFIVGEVPRPSVFASYLIRAVPAKSVDATYLKRFCEAPLYWDQLRAGSMGTGQPNVNASTLSRIWVPVPPLPEQRRIVARVNELMALLDRLEAIRQERDTARAAARDSALAALRDAPTPDDVEVAWLRVQDRFQDLFTTPEDIEPLHQAILQLAVRGRMVAQDPKDGSAARTLAKIKEARMRMVRAGQLRPPKTLPSVSVDESGFELPLGWTLARLGDVLLDIQPGWSPQCEGRRRQGEEWGVLKVSACSWGRFLPEENKALPSHHDIPTEIEVKSGDWIISRANTTELVGRSVIAEGCPPHLLLSDKTLRLVPSPGFDPRWGNLVNLSPASREHYADKAGGTSSSMRNISQDVIRNLIIPIPPEAEQARIFCAFSTLMATCQRLEVAVKGLLELHENLAVAAVHHLDV